MMKTHTNQLSTHHINNIIVMKATTLTTVKLKYPSQKLLNKHQTHLQYKQ